MKPCDVAVGCLVELKSGDLGYMSDLARWEPVRTTDTGSCRLVGSSRGINKQSQVDTDFAREHQSL